MMGHLRVLIVVGLLGCTTLLTTCGLMVVPEASLMMSPGELTSRGN